MFFCSLWEKCIQQCIVATVRQTHISLCEGGGHHTSCYAVAAYDRSPHEHSMGTMNACTCMRTLCCMCARMQWVGVMGERGAHHSQHAPFGSAVIAAPRHDHLLTREGGRDGREGGVDRTDVRRVDRTDIRLIVYRWNSVQHACAFTNERTDGRTHARTHTASVTAASHGPASPRPQPASPRHYPASVTAAPKPHDRCLHTTR